MKNFFSIKEHKKESVCLNCGSKLIDDFCANCNKYSSAEIAHKKIKEKYPHVKCKCKSKKIEFSIEEQKSPTPTNILDKKALELLEKYNQKYPQNIPEYREVARCKKCGNKWYVDGYRDDNKIMISIRNGFLILSVIVLFALIITVGSISENNQDDFETSEIETTSQITQIDTEDSTTELIEISTTEDITETSEQADYYEEIGSDLEIVSKANHPKYLDDIKIANDVWENEIKEKKVYITDSFYSSSTGDYIIKILTSEEEDDNGNEVEYISSIDIYFDRFDETVSLEEALNIISTYLPKEKIQEYYVEEMSFSELTDFENQTKYAKSYELKDDSYNDLVQLDSSFGVMVWADENGNATEAKIAYVVFSEFDDETMDDWTYDYFATTNEDPVITTTEAITTTETTTRETTTRETTVKSGITVYITPYGEKYHYSASCAGDNAMERDYDDVKNAYGPCQKCAY